jgi:serine/threonine protein kinase
MGGAGSFFGKRISRNDFVIGGVIGMGGFGIREVRHTKTNVWYAMKEYDLMKLKTVEEADVVTNELHALKRVHKHPFILQLYAAFRERNTVSFMLELLTAGDLRLSLQSGETYTQKQIAYIVACIGSALRFLHLHRILHRNVKPDNIMLSANGVPKLVDFAMSYVHPYDSKVCVCSKVSGTREYFAPEVFVGPSNYHSYESDFWSLGVVMFELLFHHHPYRSIPLELVRYSHDTYHAAWETLTKHQTIGAINDLTPIAIETTVLDDRTTSSILDQSNFIELGTFVIQSSDLPLDPQLRVHIPSSQNRAISDHCKSLLQSLLEVRIHRRIGSGRRYQDFSTHQWFSANEIEAEMVHLFPSPITPNFASVSGQIFGKYLMANLENQNSLRRREGPDPKIEKTIGSIQYFSREYLQLMDSKSLS